MDSAFALVDVLLDSARAFLDREDLEDAERCIRHALRQEGYAR